MTIKNFCDIRSKLPFQYAKLIARKLDGISALHVRMVFKGEITDPEKVAKVLEEAKKLAVTYAEHERILNKKKRNYTCRTTKPTV